MKFDDAPDVLTVSEAAALARMGRNQMYEAIHRNEIPAVRVGARSLRVSKAALMEALGVPPTSQAQEGRTGTATAAGSPTESSTEVRRVIRRRTRP